MKIHFYGAAQCVTGSCYLVETETNKFLVDCGMFQGSKVLKDRNYNEFAFKPSEIDFVLLTHAHIDHSGLIPKLVKAGFKGRVYCSDATKDLCSLMLPDSGFIQVMEVERKNRKLSRAGEPLLSPIYTPEDADFAMTQFIGLPLKKTITINDNTKFRLNEAGHILGATIIELWTDNKKIIFSGDIGNKGQPIIKDPDYIKDADYLVIESTYGNRNHEDKDNKEEMLVEIIKRTFERGGNLVIPAFAVERTQDLIYYLHKVKNANIFDELKIYVDSPLAVNSTEVFCRRREYYDDETNSLIEYDNTCPFVFDDVTYTQSVKDSMELNEIKSGAIIISASGMAEAGRIKHHLKHNLWREECTVLFVGYQAVGTLGRKIRDGEKVVRIHGEGVAVKAEIVSIDGFSAHADQNGLIEWLEHFESFPGQVFVVHGEEDSSSEFAKLVSEKFKTKVVLPKLDEVYEIDDANTAQIVAANEMTDKQVKVLYGEVIRMLDTKVTAGLSRKEYQRLIDKLSMVADYINKI